MSKLLAELGMQNKATVEINWIARLNMPNNKVFWETHKTAVLEQAFVKYL